jgi:alpha-amylase
VKPTLMPAIPLTILGLIVASCGPTPPSASPFPSTPSAVVSASPQTPMGTLASSDTPDWFQGAVLYEIFVRSFADSNGDGIGDLNGITEHLGYIQSLGATAIWLTPIYPSPSVHGYDVTDYFAVRPEYGTRADLQALVEAAHARGLRLILDFVPSHLSSLHPFFQDALGDPGSAYADWFLWTNAAHTTYASFDGVSGMPRFNHHNPEVVDYLSEAALSWLDLDDDGDYQDGVDGFRVDNVVFPPREFLEALRQRIKSVNPSALLLGEAWVDRARYLAGYFDEEFDALFDFPLYGIVQGDPGINGDGVLAGGPFPLMLTSLFGDEAELFPPQAMLVRFFSNHDTNRIATELSGDPARQRLAAALLATLPGPVMVYYGEEIGMLGEKGGPPYWDSYRREPMEWYASQAGPSQTTWFRPDDRWNLPFDGISVEEETPDPDSLLNYYRQVLGLRREHPALSQGDLAPLDLPTRPSGPWGIVLSSGSETLVGLFNFADSPLEVSVSAFPLSAPWLRDLLSGQLLPGPSADGTLSLPLPPAAAFILAAAD